MTGSEILSKYSTPGLRKNELSRSAKKMNLQETQKHLNRDEINKILIDLYGPEPESASITEKENTK